MTRALLATAILCALPAPAFADEVFGAPRAGKLEDVVWALTASCANHGDDTQQRQCRQIRDARVKALSGPLLVEGDATAFVVGAYDAAKKSAPISLVGCVHCAPISIEGKTYQVFGGAPRLADGKAQPPVLHDKADTFADVAAYTRWKTAVASARVDFVVKVPDKRTWTVGNHSGVQLDVVGYRVVVPCTGEVILAKPASPPAAPDKKACAPAPKPVSPNSRS